MKKFGLKLVIFILGIVIGLLLRETPQLAEIPFINYYLMPVIAHHQLLVVVILVTIIGIILVTTKKD
ncbi:MAG: hypothetical protein FWG67_08780 [Defluviitaleaceae bacterium]|nr:hypothetical protein [Defluviitaleaceae bacterium]